MNTKVWAHRGASAYAPENTLEAFELAAQMHADGVELDIQLTRDGEVVVTHDEEIKRVTGQPGYVKDYTLAELKQMQFNRTHPEFDNARIPTLEEVYRLLKPTGLTINVELKTTINVELKTGIFWYKGIEEKALQLTKDLGMEDAVIYSSFNHYTLVHMRKLNSSIRTGLLYSDDWIDVFPYAKNTALVNYLHPALYHLQEITCTPRFTICRIRPTPRRHTRSGWRHMSGRSMTKSI